MDTDLDAARELFEVNFIGLIASCQTFGTMLARTANSGRGDTRATILNTGSLVGVRGEPFT